MGTPTPTDRDGLRHVLGVLRYYYFGVTNQEKQRARLRLLSGLDVEGVVLRSAWKPEHESAMREALEEVSKGDWLMVYDPSQPVYVWTDASGNYGYCVTAAQFCKETGKARPISYFSAG